MKRKLLVIALFALLFMSLAICTSKGVNGYESIPESNSCIFHIQ